VPGWKYWFVGIDVTESKRTKRALEKAHTEAEKLVEERTAELIKANEQLKRENEERSRAEEELLIYQAKLRSLSSELLLTEERERRRIATDLHDRIGHALANSAIKLGLMQKSSFSAGFAGEVEEIRKIIDQTIQDTSSLTFEISPPMLYDLGLEAAIDWLVEQIQKQHNILIEFGDDGQPKPMDVSFRVLIFQAIRELLFNIVKHARAKHAKVFIRRDGDDIRIDIEDDGLGFDTSAINSGVGRTKGFGLFSIRERLSHLGGYLEVDSELGKGSRITMVSPMKFDEEI
jgi:signal transduction histidine kinase